MYQLKRAEALPSRENRTATSLNGALEEFTVKSNRKEVIFMTLWLFAIS